MHHQLKQDSLQPDNSQEDYCFNKFSSVFHILSNSVFSLNEHKISIIHSLYTYAFNHLTFHFNVPVDTRCRMSNLFTPLWWQYHDIVVPKDGISIKTKYFLVFFEFVCMWTWLMRSWLITNLQSKDILKYSFRFFLPIQTITWKITRVVEYFTPRWQKSGFFEKYHSNDTNFVLKFHPSLQQ